MQMMLWDTLAFLPYPLGVLDVNDFCEMRDLPGVRLWLMTFASGSV